MSIDHLDHEDAGRLENEMAKGAISNTVGPDIANARQVGGQHYKTSHGLEHWDIVAMFDLDYFQGQITKYVMRWKKKGGIADLEKAAHFLQKYIEVEKAKFAHREGKPHGGAD